MNPDWNAVNAALVAPFPNSSIQWRAGATTKDGKRAMALPYADSREYEKRLDEIAPGAWECSFQPWGENKVICRLTIFSVMRSSTGEATDDDGFAVGTAAEAQAFKRACSKFGLGRYLYDVPDYWVDYDKAKKKLVGKLPTIQVAAPTVTPPVAQHKEEGLTADGTLTNARAASMHKELGKLGIKTPEHYEWASKVTEREITSLTQLTGKEANEVYWRAKSHMEASAVLN